MTYVGVPVETLVYVHSKAFYAVYVFNDMSV